MAGALKVFVSYSHADDAYADQFVQALVSAGLDVWYDHQMLNGSGFAETIETELMSRPIFIVLLSKSSIGSQWVEREIQLALNLARRDPSRLIIPVMIEPVSEEQLPMMLTVLHRYDGSRTSPVRIAEMVLRGLGHAMPSDHPDSDAMITRGAALRASGNLAGALAILSDAVREASDSIVAWVYYEASSLAEGQSSW